jgi:hypothetical protein
MPRNILPIKPLAKALDTSYPALNQDPLSSSWPTVNVQVDTNRIKRRWDYTPERTLTTGQIGQYATLYKRGTGTTNTLILTTTDLIKKETATGKTWSFLTPLYTTGSIQGVSGATITGTNPTNTDWSNATLRPAAGDKFIINADLTADEEPDTNWGTILNVGSDTSLTLTSPYTGAATNGAYRIRKLYGVPADERWQFAVVNDTFCFTNGNDYVQKWDGSAATAVDLDTTNAVRARYCTCYANRLILADMYLSAVRQPWTIKWSKEGDPTDWTDSTAGEIDFADTDEPITGLGRAGNNLIVFKKNAYWIGSRTGKPTDPFVFPTSKMGVGNWAPYSLVEAAGTCFWMGHDNFYALNGEAWEPIGDAIKYEFFNHVNDTERTKIWGVHNPRYNEILWFATTDDGQKAFSYKYAENSWTTYTYPETVTGFLK